MAQVANTSLLPTPPPETTAPKPAGTHCVDNTFQMMTPENIAFHYRLAGPFQRLFPYLLDLGIVGAAFGTLVVLISFLLFFISSFLVATGRGGFAEILSSMSVIFSVVGLFLVYWFYGAYFETYFNGQTLGKRAMGIRVLSTDGHAIDGVQATLRNFFRGIDLMPMLPLAGMLESNEFTPSVGVPTALFGIIVMSVSVRFQRLGDLVAGTMVVIKETSQNPEIKTFDDPRVPQLAELIPESFYVSSSLSKTVAEYIGRRERLGIARSTEIASKLAQYLSREFGLPPDTDSDLLICSLYYKVFVGSALPEERLGQILNQDVNR